MHTLASERPWLLIAVLALTAGGCASVAMVTGQTEATDAALQSETAATTTVMGRQHRVVVAFNDMTGNDGKLILGDSSRMVLKGTSLLGWSYSEDRGRSWIYGGKVLPPPGWSVLWGDPAATTSRVDSAVAFISNLAVSDARFPAGGINGDLSSFMSGACIARTLDGGATFSPYQCVTTDGHFYDGASMAATPCGEIFAAFFDITSTKIRVWRARDHNAAFELVGDPFPDLIVASHPRLRASDDGWVYAATDVNTQSGIFVYMNRFRNGQWDTPVRVSETTVRYPTVNLGATVQGSPLAIRTGPQFSFDIGASSAGGNDAIRLLYTRFDPPSQRLYVEGAACAADLANCHPVPQWRSGPNAPGEPPRDVFNPSVAAWSGTMSRPPVWTSSFYARVGSNVTTVGLARMYLGYLNGIPFGIPVSLAQDITVCPDRRGYWGDYDDMLQAGFDGETPVFIRFTTADHNKGCINRWSFSARHQHVQSVREPQ